MSTCNRNIYFQTINQCFVVYRFVCKRKRQVVIEQTRFLSTVFLCSEFKLENYLLWSKFLQEKCFR